MIDTVYNVLDRDADSTMGIVREIAGLFDREGEKDKQVAVLEALNGFRVEVSPTAAPPTLLLASVLMVDKCLERE